MSEERRLKAHDVYVEESRQFDYYVTGGAGAALAYALQLSTPTVTQRFGILLPGAWGLLLASVAGGLWHLRLKVLIHANNSSFHERGLDIDKLSEAIRTRQHATHGDTGVTIHPDAAPHVIALAENAREAARSSIRRMQTRAMVAGWMRDLGLIGGIAALAAWRFLGWRAGIGP